MAERRFVQTNKIKDAVKGRETEVLDALQVDWKSAQPHIACPYPDHEDNDPSWRWDVDKARAYCTCIDNANSIFDVVMAIENIEFEAAKIRVAELLGRVDLIEKRNGYQAIGAEGLLNAPADDRDDALPLAYLAYRLGVGPSEQVLQPSTPIAGLKALGYFDPPSQGSKAKPKLVGHFPCAVFGSTSADGRTHAHRIYLAPGGAGKADLGVGPDGRPREPKKSALVTDGVSRAGCAVAWGDPSRALHLLLTEGIETGAAVVSAFRHAVDAGDVAVVAAISATGVEAFQVYPATKRVTVCADRDEAVKANGQQGSRRGEQAARKFAILNEERVAVDIALPGGQGETVDWLDVLTRDGVEAVRAGIEAAAPYTATATEEEKARHDRHGAARLQKYAQIYPLPKMDTLHLQYAYTATGKVKVHRWSGWDTDPADGTRRPVLTPVATPFGVPARLRSADEQSAYGLRCVVEDMDGRPRAIDFDRSELPRQSAAEILSKLFAAGLRTEADGEKAVLQSLKAASPEHEILVFRRPGWHDLAGSSAPIFICPSGEVIGAPEGLELELAEATRLEQSVASAGDFAGWKRAAEAALSVTGCPHWALGILAGFTGILVSLLQLDTCGINLSGLSSSGKSTAQRLAVSAWSTPNLRRPGLAQSARSTDNATEALAQLASGTVLSLDDLAHVSGTQLGKMIYMIASGVGKRRMKSDATLRPSYGWSTFAILSAECSLEDKVLADNGQWRAGMAARIPDVDVTDVDRHVDPTTLRLIDQVEENYGHAGPAFVRGLIEHEIHSRPHALLDRVSMASREIAGADADSATARAAMPFALLFVAGQLAKAFGIIPRNALTDEESLWGWERFQQSTDSRALDPEAQALDSLRRYIAERWDVTIRHVDPSPFKSNSREVVGWYDDTAVYIPKKRMPEAIGHVLKDTQIGRLLDRQGLLAKRSESDRYTVSWVPKVGRIECYALRRSEFGRREQANEEPRFTLVHEAANA